MDEFPAGLDGDSSISSGISPVCWLNSIHQIPKISVELMTCLHKFWDESSGPLKANGWKPTKIQVLKMMFLFRMIPRLLFGRFFTVCKLFRFLYTHLYIGPLEKKHPVKIRQLEKPYLHRWCNRIRSNSTLSMSLKNEHHRWVAPPSWWSLEVGACRETPKVANTPPTVEKPGK